MVTAVYAGSFDPITYGHLDIIEDGANIFKKLIVAVASNCDKKPFLDIETRVRLIKECTCLYTNVEVCSFEGLTVEFAKQVKADILLRGLRNTTDFYYEKELAEVNEKLSKDIKTLFLPAKLEHSFVSSSAVREILLHKGNISNFVPANVEEYLLAHYLS